jgi:hypothetical protein
MDEPLCTPYSVHGRRTKRGVVAEFIFIYERQDFCLLLHRATDIIDICAVDENKMVTGR